MTNQTCAVQDCGREIPDIEYVCSPCGDRLTRLLAVVGDRTVERRRVLSKPHLPEHQRCPDCGTGIPGHPIVNTYRETGLPTTERGLAGELEVSMSKPSLHVDVDDAGEARIVLPYGYRAAEARWTLRDALTATGDEIARVRGLFRPYNSLQVLAAWLSSQVDWMRHQPAGGVLIGDLLDALRQAVRSIDNPARRLLIGACDATTVDEQGASVECGEQLYAREYDVEVECPRCGTTHTTRDTWDRMLDKSEDLLMTRTEIARALAGFGVTVSEKRLENWATRGRLLRRGMSTGRPARPLYRLGDVRDLLAEANRASST